MKRSSHFDVSSTKDNQAIHGSAYLPKADFY